MLDSAQKIIIRGGKHLGLSDEQIDELLRFEAEHEFEITAPDGSKHKAFRIQHSNKLGPFKGGIRFHPEVSADEVRALATLMSLKTSAVGLPLGGGKGGVIINPREHNAETIEHIAREYVRGLHAHIGPHKDIPAPDVNIDAQIIDWMVDEYATLTGDKTKASFTGKSIAAGGSHGREEATGYGGYVVLQKSLELTGYKEHRISFAVHGFGNAGMNFAIKASDEHKNWVLKGTSDSKSAILSNADDGFLVDDLVQFKETRAARFSDYLGKNVVHISNDELLSSEVDVLVLASLGGVITEENADEIKAKYILELANGPITDEAAEILNKKGIIIIPDIIANAGGVVVSYLEWRQNLRNERWDESKVNQKMTEILNEAIYKCFDYAAKHSLPLKDAAFILAIKRLIEEK